MPRQSVSVDGTIRTVNHDPAPAEAARYRALLKGRLVDELTDRPIGSRARVTTTEHGLIPRTGENGLFGLAGVPARLFAASDLATRSHTLRYAVRVPGYLPWSDSASLGPLPGFPERFTPLDLGVIAMRREPVVLSGIVLRRSATPAPLAGAVVSVAALWRKLPASNSNPPADPLHVVSLHAALYRSRSSGARVRRRALNPVAGEDKRVSKAVGPGDDRLDLSDAVNLSAGEIIAVDTDQPAITEYVRIKTVGATGGAARIGLDHPLAHPHRPGAAVRRMQLGAAGADNALGVAARAGDVCLLLDDVADLDSSDILEIQGDGAPDEWHRFDRFAVSSDADGYFQFPPLQRVAQLSLTAVLGGDSTSVDALVPDYRSGRHWLEISL